MIIDPWYLNRFRETISAKPKRRKGVVSDADMLPDPVEVSKHTGVQVTLSDGQKFTIREKDAYRGGVVLEVMCEDGWLMVAPNSGNVISVVATP